MADDSTPAGNESVTDERKAVLSGTSLNLFPDLNKRWTDEAYGQPPIPKTPEEVTETVEATKEETAQPDENTNPVDDFLDTAEFGNKKVKVKVDGVETEVTFKDLLKGYQLERHLTQKGQKLSEKEKALREIEETIIGKASTPAAIPVEQDPIGEVIDPYTKPLKEEIADLRKTIKELKGATQPLEYRQNLMRVDNHLRKSGYDDFMTYVPEIEQFITDLPIEQQAEYDTPKDFMNLYKDFKIRDLKKPPPKVNPDERPKPKVSNIHVESSAGSTATTDEDALKDKTLFDKAVESGRTEDWMAVLNHRKK